MGDLGAREEDLVLIGRRQGYRPGAAAGTVQQIWRAIGKAAGTGYILKANGQAEARQRRVVGKTVIGQYRPAIGRCGSERADRRGGRDMGVLEIRCYGPGRRIVI